MVLVTKLKHMPIIWEDIIKSTSAITAKNQSERIYAYSQGMKTAPLCECGKSLTFVSVVAGYREFCSRSCDHAKKAATERRVQSMNLNGGVGLANPKSRAKAAQTLQDKHGMGTINPGQIKSNRHRMKIHNPMFDPTSVIKIGETLAAKYGNHIQNASHIHLNEFQCNLLTSPDMFAQFVAGKSCTQVANESGINYTTILNLAKKLDVLNLMVYNHRSEM